jgi:hypothetical protein
MLANPDGQRAGTLAAYVLLRPEEGWPYLRSLLADPAQPFGTRYSALLAVRFFWGERKDVLPKADLMLALMPLLDQSDMVDFAVEDFRRWERWGLTKAVLGVWSKARDGPAVVRRAVLRFALQSPHPQAVAFVQQQRRADPQGLAEVEELLRLATDSATVPGKGAAVSPR